MKRRKPILAVFVVLLLAVAVPILAAWHMGMFTRVRQVGEDNLSGLTTAQIRGRYGNPDELDISRPTEPLWIYYCGNVGGGTGITFRNGVVAHVEMRGVQ